MGLKTWLIIPDLHFPYHDESFCDLVTKIIRKIKPSGIVQLGDFCDWFQLSNYDRSPARVNSAKEDLDLYSKQLDLWEAAAQPGTEFRQLEGNHEDRYRRYLWSKAPHLAGMTKDIQEMLSFKDRNREGRCRWRWFDMSKWDACRLGDVVLHHGYYYNKSIAVNNLDKYPVKLITGHTHRVQFASNGSRWACSLGHGSIESMIAHRPVPEAWQQAFGILHLVDGIGHLEVVLVRDGECVFRGELSK